jgi:hypothetical protein
MSWPLLWACGPPVGCGTDAMALSAADGWIRPCHDRHAHRGPPRPPTARRRSEHGVGKASWSCKLCAATIEVRAMEQENKARYGQASMYRTVQ